MIYQYTLFPLRNGKKIIHSIFASNNIFHLKVLEEERQVLHRVILVEYLSWKDTLWKFTFEYSKCYNNIFCFIHRLLPKDDEKVEEVWFRYIKDAHLLTFGPNHVPAGGDCPRRGGRWHSAKLLTSVYLKFTKIYVLLLLLLWDIYI